MIQWIGAICVVGACGACGFSMAASYTGLQRCLQQLQNGLELMQCQMEYQMTELPELCAILASACTGPVGKFFGTLGHKIINADLCDLKGKLNFGCYDVVVCNPPYKIGGGGIKNPTSARLIARHESECTLDDICSAASKLLQFGGRFYMCQRPERLGDVMESMRKFDIEPKTLRLVQQRVSKAPKLFLLEGRRGGKRGFLNVLPTLFIEDESGNFSKEMLEIYGSYKSDHLENTEDNKL